MLSPKVPRVQSQPRLLATLIDAHRTKPRKLLVIDEQHVALLSVTGNITTLLYISHCLTLSLIELIFLSFKLSPRSSYNQRKLIFPLLIQTNNRIRGLFTDAIYARQMLNNIHVIV